MTPYEGLRRCRVKPPTPQFLRDVLLVLCLILALQLYWLGLGHYLQSLSNPMPMKFILATSFCVGAMYELKGNASRQGVIAILVIAIIFAIAPWLSIVIRGWYLGIIAELKSVHEATEMIGVEYVRAVENPAIGIGSCFAMATAALRLSCYRMFKYWLTRMLLINGDQNVCPHCGQIVPK
ncbi:MULTISPECIES: hypothetical protein [Aeromonas]|uniref:Uncharacterized protein n=1 Tax=Aeromonas veronii TaxID=654 RepID=A0A4S5CNF1_AERVE|nr:MULTISPECIES: hypothetical protein [Aeromonas]THJ45038.1 hypothetical protein E8Q35_12695 [Aeromonas veronii]